MNITLFAGHLGQDATVTTLQSGDHAINFSIASSTKFKDAAGVQHERTTWANCSKFVQAGGSTNVAQYLRKGQPVVVLGEARDRLFTRNDGTPGSSFDVKVRQIELLGGSPDPRATQIAASYDACNASEQEQVKAIFRQARERGKQAEQPAQPAQESDDDLPF